ncbi:hypothetical protein [Ruegeria sp. HKCCD7296]|uniref:hypothetical protein n=1 Tax=Ruegeria sp. HKCCD7296 TaxID=2683012 RepID=UPI00149230B4|nr:hypothetical protein [Ruegeria sp. HKCCD7296]NOD36630.1 hypothetical protein [Ruegeria sp. HKCCD7296]
MNSESRKIIGVAIGAEVLIIGAGLSLAGAIGWQSFSEHHDIALATSAAAFPLILACLELFKIPAGYALYRARWIMKPFALLLLAGGIVATFETVTMAGSTWFRSVQYDVQLAQTELEALRQRRDGLETDVSFEAQKSVIAALQAQLDNLNTSAESKDLSAKLTQAKSDRVALLNRASEMRDKFGAEWDAQTADNERRADSDNPVIRSQGEASQRSLPTRVNYIAAEMSRWQAREGGLIETELQRITAMIADAEAERAVLVKSESFGPEIALVQQQLMEANTALLTAQKAAAQAVIDKISLGIEIEKARLHVAEKASASIIYDIAAKWYTTPIGDVTEQQANEVTKWIVGGVAAAAALSTGMAAFVAAHIASSPPALPFGQALRRYVLRRRWRRKQTVEKVVYKDRIVHKYLPITEGLTNLKDRSIREELKLRSVNDG